MTGENTGILAGKTAIVTGSARNIGRAIAIALGADGANVVVNAVRDKEAAEEVAREVTAAGGKGVVHVCDITKRKAAQKMVETAINEFGSVDILVCNAGSQPGRDRRLLVDLEEDAITNERNMCDLLREKAKHRGLNSPGSIVFWARVPDVHESWFMLTDVLRGIVIPTVDAGVPDPIITNHKELGSNYYSVSNMCEHHFGIWVKAHLRSRNIVSI